MKGGNHTMTEEENRKPITIHLLPSTIKQLEKMSYYLSVREHQNIGIERIIKAA